MDRPVLVPRAETRSLREPEPRDTIEENSSQSVPEGQQSGFCRDGTIGERSEKDADFDEDGTKLMPYLRQIHKLGQLVPRTKVAGELSNLDVEDLDAGNQSFFNQPITERKTESDVATRSSGEGNGTVGDNPITEASDAEDRPPANKISKLAFKLQGHTTFQGLRIAVENRAGSVRSGVDKDGHKWRTKMIYPYGYIESTEGADGDGVDCYVGPDAGAESAFVVHQVSPQTGKYDEDKIMLGLRSVEEARQVFLAHYDDPAFLGPIEEVPMAELPRLLKKHKGEKLTKKASLFQRLADGGGLNRESGGYFGDGGPVQVHVKRAFAVKFQGTRRSGGGNAPSGEHLVDGRFTDAEVLRDGSDGASLLSHVQSGAEVPFKGASMHFPMHPLSSKFKVADVVVKSVPVFVVYDFFRKQAAPQVFTHDGSVLKNLFSGDVDQPVLGSATKEASVPISLFHETHPNSSLSASQPQRLVKISSITVRSFLQELQKIAFDPVMEMGPEQQGPTIGGPAPWQPYQAPAPPPRPFGDAAQDLRSARKTVNLARKLWSARSAIPMLL